MITYLLNWIKSLFKEQKDEHLQLYENVKSHCDNHPKYKHRCKDCQEAIK